MKKKKQSLLWEVSFEDHTHKSYVFGTMHVKSKKVFSAFDQIADHINLCDAFCLEIDMGLSNDPALQARMMLPPDKAIDKCLTPKEVQRLSSILHRIGGPEVRMVNFVRPMNLISLMSSLIMKEDESTILDLSLYNYAKSQDKRTFGIETKEEHLAILDKLSLESEIQQLRSIIRQFSSFKKMHHKMMSYYLNGQIDKLYQSGKKSLGTWRKTLLKDRNIKMAERLVSLSEHESIFCAVGAGHLAGKYGVLRLLKLQGAKVKPIKLVFQ